MSTTSGPEGPGGATSNNNDMGSSAVFGETETSSHVDWKTPIFMALWLVFLGLLLLVVVSHFKSKKQQQAAQVERQQQELQVDQEKTEHIEQEEFHDKHHNSAGSYIALLALLIAFPLSVTSQTSCEFLSVDDDNDSRFLSLGLWSVAMVYDGPWGEGGSGNCHNHASSENQIDFDVDTATRVAQVAGILASIIGGTFLLYTVVSIVCFPEKRLFYKWLAVPLLLATICQGLTSLVGASEYCHDVGCTVDVGFLSAVTAMGYWLLAALCAFFQ